MFSFFKRSTTKEIKGYKITTVDRKRKYGIAADSLKMLKEKAEAKLQIENCRVYLSKDGTEVQEESYFMTIEPQTLFVIASDTEIIKTDFELMYEAIRNVQMDILSAGDIIKNFVNENRSEFDKFLQEFQSSAKPNENILLSHRNEHKEWFAGVPPGIVTKEEAMARRSQDRIRGYFYKTKEEFLKSEIYRKNETARQILNKILDLFRQFLIGVDFFGVFFNRKYDNRYRRKRALRDELDGVSQPARKKLKLSIQKVFNETRLKKELCVSLCNEIGEFRCHGVWNSDDCKYNSHFINPYESREAVILFQIWNLDHQIEISRSVIPKILHDVQQIAEEKISCRVHKRPAKTISIIKYFKELFTIKNLKLVHIICHDKGAHSLKSNGTVLCEKCDEYKKLDRILQKINEN